MRNDRPNFNRNRSASTEAARTRALLARLRAAIAGGDSWVFATDHETRANVFRALAGLLVLNGTAAENVVLAELAMTATDLRQTLPLTVLAVSKNVLTSEEAAYFMARVTGCGVAARLELLSHIRSGRDLFPVGSDPDGITVALDRLRTGSCSPDETHTN